MKSVLRLVLILGISGFFVWLSMRDVKFGEVVVALRGANYFGFAAVMAVTILGFWIRAIRWRFFVQSERRISTDSLFSATMIGFMANNVLPFRLGEFVRPWVLARREKLSKTTLLATIVVERAIDMLALLFIFGVSLLIHPIAETTDAGKLVQWGGKVLVGLCVALIAFVVVVERNAKLAHLLTDVVTRPLPAGLKGKAARALDHFLEGLGLVRDIGRLAIVFSMSIVMFLCFAVALGLTAWSLGIQAPWYSGLVMLVITAIGIMVPAAPGYIGTLNYACTVGLKLFGVVGAPAAAYGWFYFFSQWIPITLVGFLYLGREGLSLHSLGQAHEDTE